jgi:hypothetical protein
LSFTLPSVEPSEANETKPFFLDISGIASSAPAATSVAAAAPASKPAPTPAATPASTSGGAGSAPASKPAASTQAPPANSAGMVWVNTESGVYHKSGTRWYGKTKQGKYMSEADAQKAGYRAAEKE